MKKLILLGSLMMSTAAFAANGPKAAELFVRVMVRGSAQLAARSAGNDSRLEAALCGQIPRKMAISSMAKTIAGNAYATAGGGARTQFNKAFAKFLAFHAVDDNLNANTSVGGVRVTGSGRSYGVGASINGRTAIYALSATKALGSISDDELAKLDAEFKGNGSAGDAIENKVAAAFVVTGIQSHGVNVILRLQREYNEYAKGASDLKTDFFAAKENIRGTCP